MPLSDSFVLSSSNPVPEACPGSLVDVIYEKFDSFPADKVALLDDATGRSFTFHELKRLTGRVASGLAKRGFGKGQVLSLFGANCIENAPIAHGALVTGGTVQLMKPAASADELRYHFDLVRPRIVVCTFCFAAAVLEALRAISLDVQDIYVIGGAVDGCRRAEELLEDAGDANPWGRVEIDPKEDVALFLQTGGTTGMSKTIPATHAACKQGVLEGLALLEEQQREFSLGYVPFNHPYSVFIPYGHWLRLGCGIVNVNSYDPTVLLKAIETHKIRRLNITPTAMVTLVNCAYLNQADLSSIELIISSGASMSEAMEELVQKTIRRKCPRVEMSQGYGMSEMAGFVSRFPLSTAPKYKRKIGSCGLLNPSFELRILSCDKQQRPCQSGEMGEIYLRATRFSKGYFKNDEETRKAFVDGWFRTGDYGCFDEDEYLFVIDRVQDLIQHRDGTVLPTRVEGILRSHPGIKDCAVIGCSNAEVGAQAMAFVVRREGCEVTAEDVQQFGAEKLLPNEQLTGGVRFVESIPKSPAGKMLRRVLIEQLKKGK